MSCEWRRQPRVCGWLPPTSRGKTRPPPCEVRPALGPQPSAALTLRTRFVRPVSRESEVAAPQTHGRRRKGGRRSLPKPITTSCGVLKQPEKQETVMRPRTRILYSLPKPHDGRGARSAPEDTGQAAESSAGDIKGQSPLAGSVDASRAKAPHFPRIVRRATVQESAERGITVRNCDCSTIR